MKDTKLKSMIDAERRDATWLHLLKFGLKLSFVDLAKNRISLHDRYSTAHKNWAVY